MSTTDPLGRVTQFTYDANGNVRTITDPLGNLRAFTYEPTFNKVTSITDPMGNLTTFEYDAQGNLTAITDPEQNKKPEPERLKTRIAYNASGQPQSTTDVLGNKTTFSYNAQGDLASITDPLGNATIRTYDTASRLLSQTDPRGKATRFAYDNLNRLTDILDALGSRTGFTYDPNGNLRTVTDARGNSITHEYDSMDRLSQRIDQLGAAETFRYDGNGNLVSTTDRKGQTTIFAYDPLNRRVRSEFADGSVATFTYDAAGRLIQADDTADPHRPIVLEYDALDRLLAETTTLGTLSYQYDALGNRTQMNLSGQAPVTYGYDANSRLRTITQGPLNPVILEYDALDRRTQLTLPNRVSTEYQYDPASRLIALKYRNALGSLGDLTYQYDPVGNRIGMGGSFARTLLPDPVATATHDAANRQLLLGGKTMTFDPNGNLTTLTEGGNTTTFGWDARDRLSNLDAPGLTARFAYDAAGRRASKAINGQALAHNYDGAELVRELDTDTQRTYLRTLEIDETLVRSDATSELYYLADALPSILGLTDPAGNLQTQYIYEPFGGSIATGGAKPNPFQYTVRENDGTGLYYYRSRYFSPELRRFISEDPIEFEGGDTNLYAYVFNSPIQLTDPNGEAIALPPGCQPGQPSSERKSFLRRFLRDLQCDPNNWLVEPGLVTGPAVGVSKILPKGLSKILPKGVQKKLGDLTGIYPKKIGAGSRLQPYDPVSGRYVPRIAPSESVASQFSAGVTQGYASAKTGVPLPIAVTPAQAWGQTIGQLVGALF